MQRVLIIDDDKFIHKVLGRFLRETYEVDDAYSGEEGVNSATASPPDLILLDVEMPGQNGYEVCDQLKQSEETHSIPVVFLSSKSSLRERLLGYEVGGEDYIVKPCEADELRIKLSRILTHAREKQEWQAKADSASSTAMEALTTSFELGKAVRFVEQSYHSVDFEMLADQLLGFCSDLDLSAVIMIRTRQRPLFMSSSRRVVPALESQILELLHGDKRFVDFGCRTQVNFPQVSILVKNMPLEDRPRYGRIKDTLPFVLGAADAKVRVLDAEQALTSQHAELNASAMAVKMTLSQLHESFGSNVSKVSQIMSDLISKLSFELRNMGLENDQEDWVLNKVEESSQRVHLCLEENLVFEGSLTEVVNLLEKLTHEQNRLLEETLKTEMIEEDNSSDIELF